MLEYSWFSITIRTIGDVEVESTAAGSCPIARLVGAEVAVRSVGRPAGPEWAALAHAGRITNAIAIKERAARCLCDAGWQIDGMLLT